VHRGGILRRSQTQTPSAPGELQAIAESYAQLLLKELDYVGVLAIEFFVVDGALVANEIAPRVHNSGHWTIEGAETSQFENHLRAILDYPLGSTRLRGCVGMLNIIGSPPPVSDVLGIPGAHLHLYGKSSRPNRKIGHITVLRDSEEQLNAALEALERITV
jgi:5-(carboxyamino)imidazole ribonucleotide synthase